VITHTSTINISKIAISTTRCDVIRSSRHVHSKCCKTLKTTSISQSNKPIRAINKMLMIHTISSPSPRHFNYFRSIKTRRYLRNIIIYLNWYRTIRYFNHIFTTTPITKASIITTSTRSCTTRSKSLIIISISGLGHVNPNTSITPRTIVPA